MYRPWRWALGALVVALVLAGVSLGGWWHAHSLSPVPFLGARAASADLTATWTWYEGGLLLSALALGVGLGIGWSAWWRDPLSAPVPSPLTADPWLNPSVDPGTWTRERFSGFLDAALYLERRGRTLAAYEVYEQAYRFTRENQALRDLAPGILLALRKRQKRLRQVSRSVSRSPFSSRKK